MTPGQNIARVLRNYGIARDTYTIRTRTDRERLPFDPYTAEVMLSNRVSAERLERCLAGSGLMVRRMSAVSLYVAA